MQSEPSQVYIGQLIYFRMIEEASVDRKILAKIALNLSGMSTDYPIDISAIATQLTWCHMNATISMLSLTANCRIVWDDIYRSRLIEWAQ